MGEPEQGLQVFREPCLPGTTKEGCKMEVAAALVSIGGAKVHGQRLNVGHRVRK